MKATDPDIVVAADLPCSRQELWQALTDPTRMRQWFFDSIPDFRAEPGFSTEFMVDAGERQFLHQWQVTVAEPLHHLAYRWRYGGYAGSGQSVFELSGEEDSSHLQIRFVVEEDFSEDVPEFTREACLGGWQYFLGQLESYLDAR